MDSEAIAKLANEKYEQSSYSVMAKFGIYFVLLHFFVSLYKPDMEMASDIQL